MINRELPEQFISSIILLVDIRNSIKDNFFYDRFNGTIFAFGLDFLEFSAEDNKENITQCQVLAERCYADISKIVDIFKEFRYLELVKSPTLLLKAEYNLLAVRLGILKRMKERSSTLDLEKGRTSENLKIAPRGSTLDLQKGRTSVNLENKELTPSKKKILEYIRSYPNTRTKDIIYEFNALSGRSVKRNLTDLLRSGLVRKRVDNKAVYYYANGVHEVQPRI